MRIPVDLAPAVALVGGVLASAGVLGGYVHGSWALGCADDGSDIDLLVVTDGAAGADLLARLGEVALSARPGLRLDVSLAPSADLRSPMTIGKAWPGIAPGSGGVTRSAHENTTHSRWLVRERGLVVAGPSPRELVGEVTAAALRADTVGRVRAAAESLEADVSSYDDGWGQPRLVLDCCRSLVSAARAEVVGRIEAAAWVRRELPLLARYDDLVLAAVADLPGRLTRAGLPADPDRLAETRSLLWDTVRLTGELALGRRRS